MPDADWFERIWEHREETLYPALFGNESEGIFTIPGHRLETGKIADPRWATCGVFRFAPTRERNTWLCVSSGLSNEWFEEAPDPDGISGFGCEFVIETRGREDWAVQRLHQIMCYQIGLCAGRYPGSDPLTVEYRVPLGSSIDFEKSILKYVLLVEPVRFSPVLVQESGSADFLQLVGISETERDFARENGNDALIEWLKANSEFPATDPDRAAMA